MYLHAYTMHICTRSRYIYICSPYAYTLPAYIHTHPLFRIKSDSLRKKYKFGIHTRGSDPFVRSYIEKKSKRKRTERTTVVGTVVETSQVVAIPHTSSSINTYTYLHVPIIYLSLPRYLVRYLVILQQHRRHKITQQKAPKNPKRKEQKKKGEKKKPSQSIKSTKKAQRSPIRAGIVVDIHPHPRTLC